MKLEPAVCPECGEDAVGVQEVVPGVALLDLQDDGSYEYRGETEMWWDDQKSVKDAEGRVTLSCSNDHEWKARPIDNEPSDPLAAEVVQP